MKTLNQFLSYALMLLWVGITLISVSAFDRTDTVSQAKDIARQHRTEIQPVNGQNFHRQLLGLPPFQN